MKFNFTRPSTLSSVKKLSSKAPLKLLLFPNPPSKLHNTCGGCCSVVFTLNRELKNAINKREGMGFYLTYNPELKSFFFLTVAWLCYCSRCTASVLLLFPIVFLCFYLLSTKVSRPQQWNVTGATAQDHNPWISIVVFQVNFFWFLPSEHGTVRCLESGAGHQSDPCLRLVYMSGPEHLRLVDFFYWNKKKSSITAGCRTLN